MSALPQPKPPVESFPHRRATQYRQTFVNRDRKTATTPTTKLIEAKPARLRLLMKIQQGSFGLALASMASSVGLYLATVSIPQVWSQEYQYLETLQRQERQLTEINETLKYQMARQAERNNSGITTFEEDSAVFVTPAEVKPKPIKSSSRDRRQEVAFKYAAPGY
ncbi:hypothetical protein [Myxosarcina sp. GI1]|uniref:hypothetical protein n=1 Tax=Myxosarcina sp. GI1 TaxID=1541065 RepID=UPI0006918A9F|nr:hypothetical protein [Myxosarcina sp. GI1]